MRMLIKNGGFLSGFHGRIHRYNIFERFFIMKGKPEDKRIIKFMIIAALLVFLLLYFNSVISLAKMLLGVIAPLLAGFAIAYILNIPLTKLERIYFPKSKSNFINKSRRGVCLLLSIVIIVGIAIIIMSVVIPQITIAFATVYDGIPEFIQNVEEWIVANQHIFPSIAEFVLEQFNNINIPTLLSNVASYVTIGIESIFNSSISIISTVTSSIFNVFMAIVFAAFLVFAKETIIAQLHKVQKAYTKPQTVKTTNFVLKTINESFHNYIIGQCTEAVILGCLCAIGMLIFGFPYAAAVGMFMGVTALIPILGAYLGSILGAVLILMTEPSKVLWFVIFVIVLQQLEGNIIYPKVVGNSIGLPGVWVLAAVVIGGGTFGIIGMVLSVPLASALYKLVSHYTNKKLETERDDIPVDYDFTEGQ